MTDYTAEELEISALIERIQDRRLSASEAAIVLVQAYAIGELSKPPTVLPGGELDRTEAAVAATKSIVGGIPAVTKKSLPK